MSMNLSELNTEMMNFLPRYEYARGKNYEPTTWGIDAILYEWHDQKANIINAFERHPNYNGRYQIVLDESFCREVDRSEIYSFYEWIKALLPEAKPFRAYVAEPDWDYYNNYSQSWVKGEMDRFIGKTCNVRAVRSDGVGVKLSLKTGNKKSCFDTDYFWFDSKHLTFIYQRGSFYPPKNSLNSSQLGALYTVMVTNANQYLDDEETKLLNEQFPALKLHNGGKTSRVIKRICHLFDLNKRDDFNARYTRFADAINPLKVKRWTILSVHPVDYWTMSFGNSWTSCQSVDKTDLNGVYSGSYHGAWSGGTESYMLDPSSIVVYTVDKTYGGNEFELEPKITRQMFHIGEGGKQMVQGRLYPQDNDSGAEASYKEMREIVQRVISECFANVNRWNPKKGTVACRSHIRTRGVHYTDYTYFENCTYMSLFDVDAESLDRIIVGANPICPTCGDRHDTRECICCRDCAREYEYECPECGEGFDSDDYDAVHTYDDNWYCCANCAERAGYVFCENDDEWHYDNSEVIYDDYMGSYYYDYYEDFVITEDGHTYGCAENAEWAGYRYAYDCGKWLREREVVWDEERGEYIRRPNEDEEVA